MPATFQSDSDIFIYEVSVLLFFFVLVFFLTVISDYLKDAIHSKIFTEKNKVAANLIH